MPPPQTVNTGNTTEPTAIKRMCVSFTNVVFVI
jgi:hypothetical protein